MNRLTHEQIRHIERQSAHFFHRLLHGSTTPNQARRRARLFLAGLLASVTLTACGGDTQSAVSRLVAEQASPSPLQPLPDEPTPQPTVTTDFGDESQALAIIPTQEPQIVQIEVTREVEVTRVVEFVQPVEVEVIKPITITVYGFVPNVEPCIDGDRACMQRWPRISQERRP